MSDIDVNKIQQNVKELQDQNAIDFQQWKKLGNDIEKLSEKIKLVNKEVSTLVEAFEKIKEKNFDVLLTVGAGNIDTLHDPIVDWLSGK